MLSVCPIDTILIKMTFVPSRVVRVLLSVANGRGRREHLSCAGRLGLGVLCVAFVNGQSSRTENQQL